MIVGSDRCRTPSPWRAWVIYVFPRRPNTASSTPVDGDRGLIPGVSGTRGRAGLAADRDRGVQVVAAGECRQQACPLESRSSRRSLLAAGLDEEMTTNNQPAGSIGDHPALDIKTVRATVEGHHRLVQPGFSRHKGDGPRRYIGGIAHHQIHPAGDPRRQRFVQVTLAYLASGADVTAGTPYGDWVEIRRIQLDLRCSHEQSRTDRARAAAQIDHYGPGPCKRSRLVNEELRAPARHKHTGLDDDLQSTELCPAENVFQRFTRNAPLHHRVQLTRRSLGSEQQPGLTFGEDTTGLSEPGRDLVTLYRCWGWCRNRDVRTRHRVAGLMATLAHTSQRRRAISRTGPLKVTTCRPPNACPHLFRENG